MYKVTKAFIYRAKLYPIGRELTEREYSRMMHDKVAIKRGIPGMVAPQDRTTKKATEPVVVDKAPKQPAKPPARKPGRPRKTAEKAEKTAEKPKTTAKKAQTAAKPKAPAKKAQPATKKKSPASAKPKKD
jgi:hypothetical protein